MAPTLYEYDAFGNMTRETLALAEQPAPDNSPIREYAFSVETRRTASIWSRRKPATMQMDIRSSPYGSSSCPNSPEFWKQKRSSLTNAA